MEASTVYYTDFRCPVGTSLTDKLRRLCIAAGIKNIDMEGKFVAIKMHFGELGNLAYLRPNYAKVVADLCKEQGGMPFLTDCNTLYPGSRKNALEHLTCAQLNGFWPMTTGCQVIIADGLRGTDEVEVPVPNGEYCKTAKIGRAIMDADIFISLTHFKGHESTGFGGAIKNIGMGCGSRAGKMEQHASGHPAVQESLCRGCHRCAKECGSDAIAYNEQNKAVIDQDKCKGCGRCIGACNFDAIYSQCDSANEMLDRKMAEYAAAVCYDRPTFHISLVQDISPNCDCHGENDAPILPDIGMFASFDPVALDQACVDACLAAAPLPNSQLGQNLAKPGWNCHHDHFKDSNPNIEWKATLEQAEKIRELYLKEVTGKQPASQIQTTVKVEEASIQLGTIQMGESKEAVFRLTNTGNNPLVILDAATTCGCARPSFDKHPAKPGEILQVRVIMTPKDKGVFDETITVKCNTNQLIKLNIRGMAQ